VASGSDEHAPFETGRPVLLDGGLATELEARGHDLSGSLWSARLLADDPDAVRDVHAAYFDAGARIAVSASYQASRRGFASVGVSAADADDLLTRSVRLALQARDAAQARAGSATPRLLVAASVGPYGATLADGSEYRGHYGLPHAELVAFHAERLAVLEAARPDLLAIETIPDAAEAAAVVEALENLHPPGGSRPFPCWISFSCMDGNRTNAGDPIDYAVRIAARAPGIVAVGVNCTAPIHVASLLRQMRTATGLPLLTYPNGGDVWDASSRTWTPSRRGGSTSGLPVELVRTWVEIGVAAVGGCCGIGPAAIRDLGRRLADPDLPPPDPDPALNTLDADDVPA
jgi:homocysteine S-methyltransferase